MIDLKAFLNAKTGQTYKAKLTMALMKGSGDLELAELAPDRLRLTGQAEVPLMGKLPLDMLFTVTGEGTGEAALMGNTYRCDMAFEGADLELKMGRDRQHRCTLSPDGKGGLDIRAVLKGRPNVKLHLVPTGDSAA